MTRKPRPLFRGAFFGLVFTITGGAMVPPLTAAEPARVSAGKAEVTLELASWKQTKQVVAAQKGKIVVLDLWSTSCLPCLKEFPGLVKLQQDFPQDVVCVSLNCDYIGGGKPEEGKKDVLDFLREKKATIKNFLSTDSDEEVYKKSQTISLPVVQVFGKDGKLAKQFDNDNDSYGKDGFTYEKHIQPFVAGLVKQK